MSLNGELMGSRGGSLQSIRRRYSVDASGEEFPEEYIGEWIELNAAPSISGLVPTQLAIDENPEIEDLYDVEITYGSTPPQPTAPSTGSVDFRFNFQAQGAHIYQSLETIEAYVEGTPGTPATGLKIFKGAVNVVSDAGKLRTEGLQIDPPSETFTLSYFPENAIITPTYQKLIADICGTVNEFDYGEYPAGSLMLVRCSGGIRTNEDWSIDFGFSYIPNDTLIPVGDITIAEKDGHDLLWAFYAEDVNGSYLVKKPTSAYVERVWRRTDFSLLGLS